MDKHGRWGLILFIIASQLYLGATVAQIYAAVRRTPSDTVYPLYHRKAHYDYNIYLSVITQGMHGEWLMRDPVTTEPTNPTLFYWYYILLGKVAGPLGLSAPVAYHASRLIFGELFLIAFYFLCRSLIGKRLAGWGAFFGIICTVAPIPLHGNPDAFTAYFPWWEVMDAVERLDIMPHYLFGYALLMVSVGLAVSFLKNPDRRTLLKLIPVIFVGGIVFPPSLMPMLFGLSVSFAVWQIPRLAKSRSLCHDWMRLSGVFVLLAVSLASLLLIWRENWNGFPWNTWNRDEINTWNVNEKGFDRSLLLSFGILPLLALPSLVSLPENPETGLVFLWVWALLPWGLLPFVNILGISKYRLISTAPFVPWGMLAAYSVACMKRLQPKFLWLIPVGLLCATAIPVTWDIWNREMDYIGKSPMFTNIYIPKPVFHALEYIDKSAPKYSVILSNQFVGNIIPAHIPYITYVGHPQHTMDFYGKLYHAAAFYSNKMSESDARLFLKNNRIFFVFYGPDERSFGSTYLAYPFLEKVFSEGGIELYKVPTL